MKIEIDLNDSLGDEEGQETLADSIRRQVIDSVKAQVKSETAKKIDEAVSVTISGAINTYLQTEMPTLLASIMDAEFQPISRYGEKSAPTSFRKELIKQIHEQMQYKKANYDSERNPFTRAVDETVKKNIDEFRTAFVKKVDAEYTQEVMTLAIKTIKDRLKIAA
jgi:hypothetical protein